MRMTVTAPVRNLWLKVGSRAISARERSSLWGEATGSEQSPASLAVSRGRWLQATAMCGRLDCVGRNGRPLRWGSPLGAGSQLGLCTTATSVCCRCGLLGRRPWWRFPGTVARRRRPRLCISERCGPPVRRRPVCRLSRASCRCLLHCRGVPGWRGPRQRRGGLLGTPHGGRAGGPGRATLSEGSWEACSIAPGVRRPCDGTSCTPWFGAEGAAQGDDDERHRPRRRAGL